MHANWREDGTSPLIDARVLDAFAGSGALGLEALSRGAAHATFLDNDAARDQADRREPAQAGREPPRPRWCAADATRPPPGREPCDLVLLDPPYRSGLAAPALTALADAGWLAPGAVVTVELAHNEDIVPPPGFEAIDERRYGAAKIVILRRHAVKLASPLYMLRHGETAWNTERRMQGTKNSDLTERGRAQALAMGRTLKAELAARARPTIFLRSPLGRARETSEIIGRELGLDPATGATIPGWPNSATASGKALRWTEIEVDASQCAGRLARRSRTAYCPPGGETHLDLRRRSADHVDRNRRLRHAHRRGEVHGVSGAVVRGLNLASMHAPCSCWKSRRTRSSAC